jgi:anti-anti-sigma factor
VTDAGEFQYEKIEMPERDAVVYRMRGVFSDTSACYDFLTTFKAALPEAPQRLILNLEHLENMYSAGVGIVAAAFTQSRKVGKTLVLVGVPKVVHKTLTLTGVLPAVREYASEAEALDAAV